MYQDPSTPLSVLLIAGSPSGQSRAAALLEQVGKGLVQGGVSRSLLDLRLLPAQPLLLGDAAQPELASALRRVKEARALVIATPVYKAAYSGLLKVFLDLLPQDALSKKWVLPLVTSGSPHHLLAIDYSLRPVLQALSAGHVLPGVYATESQIVRQAEGSYLLSLETKVRLEQAVAELLDKLSGTRMHSKHQAEAFIEPSLRCHA